MFECKPWRRTNAARLLCLWSLALSPGALWAEATEPTSPRTWNPWGKESPEPYGYDVRTAPDLPLGHVDAGDPPAQLGAEVIAPALGASWRAALTVSTNVDRTAYSWFGTAVVTADVSLLGAPVVDCDSVVALSAANPRVRARLRDDGLAPDQAAGDGRYSGWFEIGAGEGEARPTGGYTVTANAYRGGDSGADASPNWSLYSVRRWTGIATTDLPDIADSYTIFQVTANGPGLGYHHRIEDLGLVRGAAVSNAQIRIPILPRESAVRNLVVTGSGVSNVGLRENVIEFDCDLTAGTVARVDIAFDADGELCATRIDRYQTGDIGLRDFRNGYLIWNRYIHTAMLGSGFSAPHGPGCFVDLHVVDLVTGAPHTVDCMERVAAHLDNAADNDGTGTYQSNIKWGGEALEWLETADLEHFVFRTVSGGNYGLSDKLRVERTVEFFPGSRFFRHEYAVRNIDVIAHDVDFVWGREQWLYGSGAGSNRDDHDRGILPEDPTSYGGEFGLDPSEIDGNWFAAFDATSFYAIGVLLPAEDPIAMPDFGYFLCDPALGNFTGQYPIVPSGSCTDMPNLFFEKRLGVLGPGAEASYAFYQWGGYGADRAELTQILWTDAEAVTEDPAGVDPLAGNLPAPSPWLAPPSPNPVANGTEVAFALPRAGRATLDLYAVDGRRVARLLDAALPAGGHVVAWSAAEVSRAGLAAGVYLLRLDAGGRHAAQKLVLER
ncbi:MAG: T9SS type A sorting domain-containing protein [Candidatus Eisenbacteria bacterium]|nr:T9SS type A sorting domain-containing protein [Candidatus Eisenbacteria bacterium]MCC7142805.1 T9SS type A sorting domain-containing protein [Candidatus Eisenbacteria bacterium]